MTEPFPAPPKAALKAVLNEVGAKRLYTGFEIRPEEITLRTPNGVAQARKPMGEPARVAAAMRPWADALMAAFTPFQTAYLDVAFDGGIGLSTHVAIPDASGAGHATRAFVRAQFLDVVGQWRRLIPDATEAHFRIDVLPRARTAPVRLTLGVGYQEFHLDDVGEGGKRWLFQLGGWTHSVNGLSFLLRIQRPSAHVLAAHAAAGARS